MSGNQTRTSRISGWHRLSRAERLAALADWLGPGTEPHALAALLDGGGLTPAVAEQMVENVAGLYALPFAVAPNFLVNGREILLPMVVEEPSVVAAAGNAARIAREGGGFTVAASPPVMTCQIQLFTDDVSRSEGLILARRSELLASARAASSAALLARGGGPVDLEVRRPAGGEPGPGEPSFLVVHLHVDVRDAMGANIVDTLAEALAPELERCCGGRAGLRILTNLTERRYVSATLELPEAALALPGFAGEEVAAGIAAASRFAELDIYRAATHNKGIMNGVDAVLLATGNDWRAVEAGAHAHAARSGRYLPLCTWRRTERGTLQGRLEMPLSCGTVGGALRTHAGAQLALRILGARTSGELAEACAAAGMACNLAALRALCSEGIQRGHMKLHRRAE